MQSQAEDETHGALWETFPSMEYILSSVLRAIEQYEHDIDATEPTPEDHTVTAARKYMKISLNNCHGKLDQYYQLINKTPIYAAATILNPAQK